MQEPNMLAFYQNIKLKPMDMASFSGEVPSEYFVFKQDFKFLVHDNPMISVAEKFGRLVEKTSGTAAELFKYLPRTPQNYFLALERLEERYGNVDKQTDYAYQHLDSVPVVDNMKTSSLSAAKSAVDRLRTYLSQIPGTNLSSHHGRVRASLNFTQRALDSFNNFCQVKSPNGFTFDVFTQWCEAQMSLLMYDGRQEKKKPKTALVTNHSEESSEDYDSDEENVMALATAAAAIDNHLKLYTKCPMCQDNHSLMKCFAFKKLTMAQRKTKIREVGACFRCLRGKHRIQKCDWTYSCRVCKSPKHNVLICPESVAATTTPTTTDTNTNTAVDNKNEVSTKEVMDFLKMLVTKTKENVTSGTVPEATALATNKQAQNSYFIAPAIIINPDTKQNVIVNVLMDTACDTNFITSQVAKALGLSGKTITQTINTLDDAKRVTSQIVDFTIRSTVTDDEETIQAYTIDTIVSNIRTPSIKALQAKFPELKKIKFPSLQDSSVDLLLGTQSYTWITDKEKQKPGQPFVMNTKLGYVVLYGQNPSKICLTTSTVEVGQANGGGLCDRQDIMEIDDPPLAESYQITFHLNEDPMKTLEDLWSMEAIGIGAEEEIEDSVPMTKAEAYAMQILQEGIEQLPNKRYRLPVMWKVGEPNLECNYEEAVRIAIRFEGRLRQKLPEVYRAAGGEIQASLESGFIKKLDPKKDDLKKGFYLPGLTVTRLDKPSTPHRVVYDCARKFAEGKCLNDAMLPGPNLLNDLLDVLIRLRMKPVVIGADVKKMYLQFQLKPEDRKYFRFCWNGDCYESISLMFGAASSPCMALFGVREHAKKYLSSHPLGARALIQDTYMDDLVTGAEDVEEAKEIVSQCNFIMTEACLPLMKWVSNQPLAIEHLEPSLVKAISSTEGEKTLGMIVDLQEDVFRYATPDLSPYLTQKVTLRTFASAAAKIYDPLGLLDPITLGPRLAMQQICAFRSLIKIGWDTDLETVASEDLQKVIGMWRRILMDYLSLSEVTFPRCIKPKGECKITLVFFSDASEMAYASTVYLRTESALGISCNLLLSRKRLAPLSERRSIPDLEMMGAVLSSRLSRRIGRIGWEISDMYFFTDSTCVLSWLAKSGRTWMTFIGNRVSQVHRMTGNYVWRHVKSKDNSADLPTRGLCVADLASSDLWKHGPAWLLQPESEFPQPKIFEPTEEVMKAASKEFRVAMAMSLIAQEAEAEPGSLAALLQQVAPLWEAEMKRPLPLSYDSFNDNYRKSVRTLGWMILFASKLRAFVLQHRKLPGDEEWAQWKEWKEEGAEFDGPMVKAAEARLFLKEQLLFYAEELRLLAKDKKFPPGQSCQGCA